MALILRRVPCPDVGDFAGTRPVREMRLRPSRLPPTAAPGMCTVPQTAPPRTVSQSKAERGDKDRKDTDLNTTPHTRTPIPAPPRSIWTPFPPAIRSRSISLGRNANPSPPGTFYWMDGTRTIIHAGDHFLLCVHHTPDTPDQTFVLNNNRPIVRLMIRKYLY